MEKNNPHTYRRWIGRVPLVGHLLEFLYWGLAVAGILLLAGACLPTPWVLLPALALYIAVVIFVYFRILKFLKRFLR